MSAPAPILCGRCGYDVRGLPGSVCPECGGDLDQVGRLRPGQRRPMRRRTRLLLGLVVSVPVTLLCGYWLDGILHRATPKWLHSSDVMTFAYPGADANDSRVATAVISGGAWYWPWSEPLPPKNVAVTITSGEAVLGIAAPDSLGGRFTYGIDNDLKPLNRQAVADFFEAAGFDVQSPDFAVTVDSMYERLQQVVRPTAEDRHGYILIHDGFNNLFTSNGWRPSDSWQSVTDHKAPTPEGTVWHYSLSSTLAVPFDRSTTALAYMICLAATVFPLRRLARRRPTDL